MGLGCLGSRGCTPGVLSKAPDLLTQLSSAQSFPWKTHKKLPLGPSFSRLSLREGVIPKTFSPLLGLKIISNSYKNSREVKNAILHIQRDKNPVLILPPPLEEQYRNDTKKEYEA